MIIQNWEAVRIIPGNSFGNIDKYWFEPLPGFDYDDFPFIVCSGSESLNLLNVKEGHHLPLIMAPIWTDGPQ